GLSFCDGESVVLTASANDSYLWSNGATIQSITVTTSGNYSVEVTNAFGCKATSGVSTVTVWPKPEVTLQAAPYLNLYPGLTTTISSGVIPADNYIYSWSYNG